MRVHDHHIKILSLVLTFFIGCFLYTVTVAVSAENSPNPNKRRIVNITPEINIAKPASLLLILPMTDLSNTSWDLYLKNPNTPFRSGKLSDQLSTIPVQISFESPGTYSAVLIIKDKNGNITSMESDQIKVLPKSLWNILAILVGPISGAFMAIIVFLVNDYLKKIREDGHLKESLRAKILREIDKFILELESQQIFTEFPSWLIDPTNSSWTHHLETAPFNHIIKSLYELHHKRNSGLLQDINKTKKTLSELKKELVK